MKDREARREINQLKVPRSVLPAELAGLSNRCLRSLSPRPSLEQLKNRAKELLIGVRSNDFDAVELFARHHPVRRLENERFALHDAQLVLARQHGSPNWTQLKEEVERRASDFSQRADRFVLDAVDGDFERARRTLDFEPELARGNLWPALAVGDVSFLRRALERDSGCADRFLLGTSRGQGDWVATARGIRWLLDHGSDPNVSCGEHHETALHVAVREDHDTEILRELLEAGADPNRADNNGVLPLTLAHRAGREDVVAALRKWGAHEVERTVGERFFEAALSGNREKALTLVRENPGLVGTFEEKDLLALNEAAKRGNVESPEITTAPRKS
ncbi:MAG: ankyrin repeat domain-containing protein [Terrimicrobiaceae bacterium]